MSDALARIRERMRQNRTQQRAADGAPVAVTPTTDGRTNVATRPETPSSDARTPLERGPSAPRPER